jgi:hypothetical protein
MSITPVAPSRHGTRRVRHQAREAAAVMAFSAGTSVVLAVALLLLTSLGR